MFNSLQKGLFGDWNEFDRMFEDMERLFGGRSLTSCRSIETKDDLATIVLEVPGLDAGDLDVQVEDNLVTVATTCEDDKLEGTVHLNEFRPIQRTQTFRLPFNVDPKGVKAICKQGLLTLTLERAQADKPKKIKVLAA